MQHQTADGYWTVSFGLAIRTGWSCRECHQVISTGEEIAVRDGRKMRFMYHKGCFSGEADPRTQTGSSYNCGRWNKGVHITTEPPESKGHGKWSVAKYGYQPTVSQNGHNAIRWGFKRREKKE